ncbi:MAG: hypothetical protein WDM88_08335 [Galbitalea sp.]
MVEGQSIARVWVDSPLPQLDRLFDYRVPEHLVSEMRVGIRVRVPLRTAGRLVDAYVIELVDSVEFTGVLSEVEGLVSPVPVLAPEVAALARRAADRSAGSAIDIVRVAVPPRQARVEKAWLAADSGSAPRLAPVRPVAVAGYERGALEGALSNGGRLAVDALPTVEAVVPPRVAVGSRLGRALGHDRGRGGIGGAGRGKVGHPRRAGLPGPGATGRGLARRPARRTDRAAGCPPVQPRPLSRLSALPG